MAVKNDYSLIYRGLRLQIGNGQQGCKAIIIRELWGRKEGITYRSWKFHGTPGAHRTSHGGVGRWGDQGLGFASVVVGEGGFASLIPVEVHLGLWGARSAVYSHVLRSPALVLQCSCRPCDSGAGGYPRPAPPAVHSLPGPSRALSVWEPQQPSLQSPGGLDRGGWGPAARASSGLPLQDWSPSFQEGNLLICDCYEQQQYHNKVLISSVKVTISALWMINHFHSRHCDG